MTYICTTCDRIFTEIPDEAIQISGGRGEIRPRTFTFPDGSFHSLRRLKTKKQPLAPAAEPKQDTELLLEVADVLAALPTRPVPVEIKTQSLPQIEPDFEEGKALTPMQLAFRRIQEK